MRPLGLRSASQFRPDGPSPLTSTAVRRGLQPGQGPGPRRQHHQDARADQPGPVLDRPRHPTVERRAASSRRRPRARSDADRPDAGDGARRRRRRSHRLLRRQVPLLVLAPLPGHPLRGHRRQPRHSGRPDLEATRHDTEPPRVPLGTRLPQHRSGHRPGCLLRHRQGHAPPGQPGTRPPPGRAYPHLRPPPRRRQGRRHGDGCSSASTSATPTSKAPPSAARSAATSPTTTSSRSAETLARRYGRRPTTTASRNALACVLVGGTCHPGVGVRFPAGE